MKLPPHDLARSKRGFSLVEVTLAVGIAALGIIAILGLMPQGLEMSRKTGEMTARRQIIEQIARDLEQRSWADLAAAASTAIYYFDDQGAACDGGAPTQAFISRVQVLPITTPVLPQGSTGEPYLRKAVIKIANTTNGGFDFSDENQKNYDLVIHYIAKSR